MQNFEIQSAFEPLADTCVRLEVPLCLAPPGIAPVVTGAHVAGHAHPVRHHGSVDVFLEAMDTAQPGDLLVIDNQGRLDEGCLGALIVWGAHRDTRELRQLGFPV